MLASALPLVFLALPLGFSFIALRSLWAERPAKARIPVTPKRLSRTLIHADIRRFALGVASFPPHANRRDP